MVINADWVPERRPHALPLPPPSTHITHPPSSMPPPPAPSRPSLSARSSAASHHPARSSSRADRHKSVSTPTPSDVDAEGDMDADAEGELEMADGDDPTLYCTCQKRSYGEMIGCDNDHCEYEWVSCSLLHIFASRLKPKLMISFTLIVWVSLSRYQRLGSVQTVFASWVYAKRRTRRGSVRLVYRRYCCMLDY